MTSWRFSVFHVKLLICLAGLPGASKATCIWKFVQRHFIASKLNAWCGGYLDKIFEILVDILDLKTGFPLAIFFIGSDFFRSKTISRIGSYFFLLRKQSLTNENLAKTRFLRKNSKWKTGLIRQTNGSKVVYLSADPNAGHFKGWFPIVCWILRNIEFKRYDWLS